MSKKWTNAPVYFVIAQVRHNLVLSLNTYAPEIQERMRKAGYPDYRPGKSVVFNFIQHRLEEPSLQQSPVSETLDRHVFLSKDGSHGFILEQGALSFQTTEYDTFETFSSALFTGLKIVHECISLDYSERVGIRYLDAVVPPDNESVLTNYLVPGVLGLAGSLPDDAPITLSFSETHISTSDANLLSRTIVRNGSLGFPMDLATQGLQIPSRFQQVNGVHAIIDTDAWQEGRKDFDLVQLQERLDMLHTKIRMAFNACVTKQAVKMWE